MASDIATGGYPGRMGDGQNDESISVCSVSCFDNLPYRSTLSHDHMRSIIIHCAYRAIHI